jgi:hypothetical protein
MSGMEAVAGHLTVVGARGFDAICRGGMGEVLKTEGVTAQKKKP